MNTFIVFIKIAAFSMSSFKAQIGANRRAATMKKNVENYFIYSKLEFAATKYIASESITILPVNDIIHIP